MVTEVIKTNELHKMDPVFGQLSFDNHEQIVFCNDKDTGLKAIIGIHNTVLGPALGGTRMWNYASEWEALNDVLRLSRGMTYKSAVAGLHLGGGKAVIIGDSRKDKSEALMRRFGQFVDSLNGRYITAEDVGFTTADIEHVSEETEHVSGLPESKGGSGDPSPVTAYGVYMGMKAAAKKAFGTDDLSGKRVMVQGVGNVGFHLVKHLAAEGAVISISDIHDDRIAKVTKEFKVAVVPADDVYHQDMDIYAPCALGATLNDETLKVLKCKVVAGAANNQLDDEQRHSKIMADNGIVFAPDFVINAGGIINCYSEVIGYNREMALKQTENIYNTALDIFKRSATENIPTYLAANQMAEERIHRISELNRRFS